MKKHKQNIIVSIIVLLFLAVMGVDLSNSRTPSLKPIPEKPLLQQVNEVRKKANLSPLVEDPKLDLAAKQKAQKLADTATRGHQLPSGEPIYFNLNAQFPNQLEAGENVAWCQKTNMETVQDWIASPEHYKTMTENWQAYGSGQATSKIDGCIYRVNYFIKY